MNHPQKRHKKLDAIPAEFCDMIEFGYWNNKNELRVDGCFTVIYSEPVIRYDDDGNHFVLCRDPKAMKRPNTKHESDTRSNSYSFHEEERKSMQDFMHEKESDLAEEFGAIRERMDQIESDKQFIADKLRKYELKKRYIEQQSLLLNGDALDIDEQEVRNSLNEISQIMHKHSISEEEEEEEEKKEIVSPTIGGWDQIKQKMHKRESIKKVPPPPIISPKIGGLTRVKQATHRQRSIDIEYAKIEKQKNKKTKAKKAKKSNRKSGYTSRVSTKSRKVKRNKARPPKPPRSILKKTKTKTKRPTVNKKSRKRINSAVDLTVSDRLQSRIFESRPKPVRFRSSKKADSKQLFRASADQDIEKQVVSDDHDAVDIAGILSVDVLRLECQLSYPHQTVAFDACKIRIISAKSGQQEVIQSATFRTENQTFYFEEHGIEFGIRQILNNALLIEVQCDDIMHDRIQITMSELTKSRDLLHRFHVFHSGALCFKTKWRLK